MIIPYTVSSIFPCVVLMPASELANYYFSDLFHLPQWHAGSDFWISCTDYFMCVWIVSTSVPRRQEFLSDFVHDLPDNGNLGRWCVTWIPRMGLYTNSFYSFYASFNHNNSENDRSLSSAYTMIQCRTAYVTRCKSPIDSTSLFDHEEWQKQH